MRCRRYVHSGLRIHVRRIPRRLQRYSAGAERVRILHCKIYMYKVQYVTHFHVFLSTPWYTFFTWRGEL